MAYRSSPFFATRSAKEVRLSIVGLPSLKHTDDIVNSPKPLG
jgi:hypothetical protein